MLRHGAWREVGQSIRRRIYSVSHFVCLCRDLSTPFESPAARIPLRLRPFHADDADILFDLKGRTTTRADLRARLFRRRLLDQGIGECYVAVTEDDRPQYVQWLIRLSEDQALHVFTGGFFPPLRSDEALLEGTFTLEEARGKGVMSWAQSELCSRAAATGIRRVLTYVAEDNLAALRACERSGFVPCSTLTERWRLFRRAVS